MKKKGLLVTVAATIWLLLGGCTSASGKNQQGSITDDTIKKETALNVYVATGKLTNYVESSAKIYNEKTGANVKLKITNVASGTATVQMITPKLVTHEDMPDIVSMADTAAAGVLDKFEDAFYSATDYGFYKEHGENFYEQKLNILKEQTENHTVVPWASDFTPAVSFYQPALFEEVGVSFNDIKSWDEYIEVAKKIMEKTGTKGIALPEAGDQELFVNLMAQQSQPLITSAGDINLGTKEAKNAVKIIKKMIDAGIVNFYGAQDGEKAFQESAMFVAGGWYAVNMSMNFPDAAGKWRMGAVIPFSEDNPGKSPVSGGSSFYVPKDGKNPEVAQQFLSFMLSDPDCLANALAEGVTTSNQLAYQTAPAEKTFDYYGGQQYNKLINELNQETADVTYPASYGDATAYLTTASYSYWKSGNFTTSYLKEAENYAYKYNVKVNTKTTAEGGNAK